MRLCDNITALKNLGPCVIYFQPAVDFAYYSKTPIYRAPIYRVLQFTVLVLYPPETSFMCKSMINLSRYAVLLDLPGLIPFPQEAR